MYFPVRKRYFLTMHDLSENSEKDLFSAPAGTLSAKTDDDIAIRLRDVRKEYRLYDSLSDQALDVLGMSWLRFWRETKYKTFAALDGIDLDIRKGERVGIVGRNGAGKTTLLKLITGNFAPTSGTIDVNGNVQALMQTGLGFHGEFTGMENIRSALAYSGLPVQDMQAAIDDIIDFCELGDFIHQPIKVYSLGMRARLQFAVSTAIKPETVIVDEILGAGDTYFNAKCAQRIRKMSESGCTLVIVSHSMQQIIQYSERCIWIENGRVELVGDSRNVVGKYEVFMSRRVNGAESKVFSKTDDFNDYLMSGVGVHRWCSRKKIKIVDLKIDKNIFVEGDEISLDIFLHDKGEDDPLFDVCIDVLNEAYERVCWFRSPLLNVSDISSKSCLKMRIKEILLLPGKYIISLSMFTHVSEQRKMYSEDNRSDLLARTMPFNVISNGDTLSGGYFYHPSDWSLG